MITELDVQNFGCVRRATLTLTPLHALIGPNDSGKSTLLRAVRTVVQLSGGTFERAADGTWSPFDPAWTEDDVQVQRGIPSQRPDQSTKASKEEEDSPVVRTSPGREAPVARTSPGREELEDEADKGTSFEWDVDASGYAVHVLRNAVEEKYYGLPRNTTMLRKWEVRPAGGKRLAYGVPTGRRTPRFLHLSPVALREPSHLIPDAAPIRLFDELGHGLAAVYDAILNRGNDEFHRIVDEIRRLFPTIRALRLRVVAADMKALEAELVSGQRVSAGQMSEGLLYFLAFAALRASDPPEVLLIEEPENGLHPARILDVMRILREISQTTQVIVATHSPLVINEMAGHEVSVVTRTADGTRVKLLSETPNFATRSQVYALGELWLSYADGVAEAPLLGEGEEP